MIFQQKLSSTPNGLYSAVFMERSLPFREDDSGKHSLQSILEIGIISNILYRNCWLLKFMSLSFNLRNDIMQQWWYIDCPVDEYSFSKYALGFFGVGVGRGDDTPITSHPARVPLFSFQPSNFCFSPLFSFLECTSSN